MTIGKNANKNYDMSECKGKSLNLYFHSNEKRRLL